MLISVRAELLCRLRQAFTAEVAMSSGQAGFGAGLLILSCHHASRQKKMCKYVGSHRAMLFLKKSILQHDRQMQSSFASPAGACHAQSAEASWRGMSFHHSCWEPAQMVHHSPAHLCWYGP